MAKDIIAMVASEIFFAFIVLFSASTTVQSIDESCSAVSDVVARVAGGEAVHDQHLVFPSKSTSNGMYTTILHCINHSCSCIVVTYNVLSNS